ncbi:type IV toxin-antitoxin system AbiEi family antitoxin domain-containing protein [Isoptericola sp. b441]|uniref:Type IV toxin-antitoxin system AbiEi family antitoxin domain-containing protein n=1 Tax=Actinotalea lenta TaxID=3064654 RepID=A0ABT9D5P8_9CELL|nr:type IV toxin-antitoxin system AbiEi family antitoxin domain-containing protein [Isoptericola sp. b441]MDO8106115.1 type IV toxin-antitoxin system AbiEi family antitoxin domain-containing protein [Isoptericola sp. b441]
MARTDDALARLAARQDGVVTTGQALSLGFSGSWLDRRVRAGHWQRLHHGVLATFSGPVGWQASARAALLYAGAGAALSHRSAAYRHEMLDRPPRPIELSIPRSRAVRPSAGVRIYRREPMPPAFGRLRTVELVHTIVDLIAGADSTDDVVGLLTDASRAGAPPAQVREALLDRPTVRGRALALELCGLAEAGVESPLELRYHRDVERRHRLPTADLQVRDVVDGQWVRADTRYRDFGVVVELDGALWHAAARRDADVWRDNAVLIARGDLTLRYRWRHVAVAPCRTAAQVATALAARGWAGTPHPCGAGCGVGRG